MGSGVLQVPTGIPDLPADPTTTELGELRAIADGALALEEQVKCHIVEPLLRMALTGWESCTLKPEYELDRPGRRGRPRPDYVVMEGSRVRSVIEAKLAIDRVRRGRSGSDAIAQTLGYAEDAGAVPAALIDTSTILLFEAGGTEPSEVLTRRTLSNDDLARIGKHLANEPTPSASG